MLLGCKELQARGKNGLARPSIRERASPGNADYLRRAILRVSVAPFACRRTKYTPDDDATPGAGVNCWITGNPRPNGNFQPGDGDVDFEAFLDSPSINAAGADALTLELARWFRMDPPGLFESSRYELLLSNDGGSNWNFIEQLSASANAWNRPSFSITLPPTSNMRIRVRVYESGPTGDDNIMEALVDDVKLSGFAYVCDSFSQPAAQSPNPVGDTLLFAKIGDSVRLDWTAPPADGSHGPATTYRVYRSASPSGGFTLHHTTTAPFRVEDGEHDVSQ